MSTARYCRKTKSERFCRNCRTRRFYPRSSWEGYGYNPYLRQAVASFVEELVKDGIVKECREPVKEKPKGKFIGYELNIDDD
jgi:hypothetical protein